MIKINGTEVELGHFPDGTFHLKPTIDKDYPVTICWHFEGNDEMCALLFLTKHIRRLGVENITLKLPYIPNARMDRVKNETDIFTLKYFADFINALNFNKVIVLDPHSSVSEALIDRIEVQTPQNLIHHTIARISEINNFHNERPLLAFYPDEGAMKRYSDMSSMAYAFGIKKRDWKTGKILGLDVSGDSHLIPHSDILIIDDISSRGGTFYHSAKKLKELGAGKIYLCVTHCEKTIFEGEIFKSGLIEKVFTTNSIFTPKVQEYAKSIGLADKIEVFNI